MKQVITYVADDGTSFLTAQDAREHEKSRELSGWLSRTYYDSGSWNVLAQQMKSDKKAELLALLEDDVP